MSHPCARCGEPVRERRNQYCSPECYRPSRVRPCYGCGKRLTRVNQKFYCSHACQFAHPMPLPWDDELRRLRVVEKKTYREIAGVLGIPQNRVEHRGQKLQLPPLTVHVGAPRKFSPEQCAVIAKLYPAGTSRDAIKAAVTALPGGRLETPEGLLRITRRLKVYRPPGATRSAARTKMTQRWTANHPPKAKPKATPGVGIPLREVYRWGADLGVPLSQRGDVAAVSRAMKRDDPTHAGFFLIGTRQ
jgi:hypothetical protein